MAKFSGVINHCSSYFTKEDTPVLPRKGDCLTDRSWNVSHYIAYFIAVMLGERVLGIGKFRSSP